MLHSAVIEMQHWASFLFVSNDQCTSAHPPLHHLLILYMDHGSSVTSMREVLPAGWDAPRHPAFHGLELSPSMCYARRPSAANRGCGWLGAGAGWGGWLVAVWLSSLRAFLPGGGRTSDGGRAALMIRALSAPSMRGSRLLRTHSHKTPHTSQ